METLIQRVAEFLANSRFEMLLDKERFEISREIEERFGVSLRWLVVEGSLRQGDEADRLKPPTKIGGYPTVRYGWVTRYRYYEGGIGDPVYNEDGQPEGVCVYVDLSWGGPQALSWQALAWVVNPE